MKLDKRHMVASVCLLGGSIIYNVWVFTRPPEGASPSRPAGTSVANAPPFSGPSTGEIGPAVVDLAQLPPVPEVQLDRLPRWSRNPFAARRAALVEVVDVAPPQTTPEPEVVVGAILYSTGRRLATVNGRIVRVGDRVGSETIIDIRPDAVVVESPTRGRRAVSLRTPSVSGREGDGLRHAPGAP